METGEEGKGKNAAEGIGILNSRLEIENVEMTKAFMFTMDLT